MSSKKKDGAKMLSDEQVKGIIAAMSAKGFQVSTKEISILLLVNQFENPQNAICALLGDSTKFTADKFLKLKKMVALREFLDAHLASKGEVPSSKKDGEYVGMTYDELKKGLEEDLKALIEVRDNGSELDARELASISGRIADIRVKLTEKFGTTDKSEEHRIVVLQKYNDICPYCGHEISISK